MTTHRKWSSNCRDEGLIGELGGKGHKPADCTPVTDQVNKFCCVARVSSWRFSDLGRCPIFSPQSRPKRTWRDRGWDVDRSLMTQSGSSKICWACPIYAPRDFFLSGSVICSALNLFSNDCCMHVAQWHNAPLREAGIRHPSPAIRRRVFGTVCGLDQHVEA